jgi:hypothetical protein
MAKGFLVKIFLGEPHPSAIPKRLIREGGTSELCFWRELAVLIRDQEADMAAIRIACALGLAAATVATPMWAGPDSQNEHAGPLPKETVYRPVCWPDIVLTDSGYPRCVRAPE